MDEKYEQVTNFLSLYEELYVQKPISAIKKMIDLYFEAIEVSNYEAADTINLWIKGTMNDEIAEYLQSKIDENNKLNRIYIKWIGKR